MSTIFSPPKQYENNIIPPETVSREAIAAQIDNNTYAGIYNSIEWNIPETPERATNLLNLEQFLNIYYNSQEPIPRHGMLRTLASCAELIGNNESTYLHKYGNLTLYRADSARITHFVRNVAGETGVAEFNKIIDAKKQIKSPPPIH